MSTTAEKIKVMQAFEDGAQIEFNRPRRKDDTRPATRGWIKWSETWEEPLWDWDFCDYRIKPSDPKPLEYWINVYPTIDVIYHNPRLAEQGLASDGRTVHVREVTPQMERDAKDAARYQRLKHMGYRSLHGYISADWDELIDKAMEEE